MSSMTCCWRGLWRSKIAWTQVLAPDRPPIEIALEAAPFAIQHIVAKYLSGQDTEG
jgi:hypothetical protein